MSASEGAPQQDPASQLNVTTIENEQAAPIQIKNQDQDDLESEAEELETAEDSLTSRELDDVTTVFRQYETGLRGGCISVKVTKTTMNIYYKSIFYQNLHRALESLGLKVEIERTNFRSENCYKHQVMEQEVIDMTNAIARDGLVFFPDFCSVVLMKFRFLKTFK